MRGIWPELSAIDPAIAVHLEIDAKYDVYLKRQTADVDAFRRDEGLILSDIDYGRCARAFQRSPRQAGGSAAADRRAGGPARWPDAGGARDSGGLSAREARRKAQPSAERSRFTRNDGRPRILRCQSRASCNRDVTAADPSSETAADRLPIELLRALRCREAA